MLSQHLECGHHKDCLTVPEYGCGWCSEERAYDLLRKQAKETEAALRQIISACAAALGNGAQCSSGASLEVMGGVPAEIKEACAALRLTTVGTVDTST